MLLLCMLLYRSTVKLNPDRSHVINMNRISISLSGKCFKGFGTWTEIITEEEEAIKLTGISD